MFGKGLNLFLYHTIPSFKDLKKEVLEKIVGKGKNAGNVFPQCFLTSEYVFLSRSNSYYQGRQFEMPFFFFFQNYSPFSLSTTP